MSAIDAVGMVSQMAQNTVSEKAQPTQGAPDAMQVSRFEQLLGSPSTLESQLIPPMKDPMTMSSPEVMIQNQAKLAASVTSVDLVANVAGKASEAINKLLNIQ